MHNKELQGHLQDWIYKLNRLVLEVEAEVEEKKMSEIWFLRKSEEAEIVSQIIIKSFLFPFRLTTRHF